MTAIEELSKINTSKVSKNMTSQGNPSDHFNNILSIIMERQQGQLSSLRNSGVYQDRAEMAESIKARMEKFFSPEENFSNNFDFVSNWFSAESGAQDSFLDKMMGLSSDKPTAAAGSIRSMFELRTSVQSSFLQASSGMNQSSMFSQITSFDFSMIATSEVGQSLPNGIPAQDTGFGTTRFAQMQVEIKYQRLMNFSKAKEEVAECELFENGGNMIEFHGKYVNVNLFMQIMDPLVLDLEGNGINLKSVKDGVLFDLAGNGEEVRSGFVQGDDALLFLDENGNGICDNGLELFGDQEGHANGFAELAEHDTNKDGIIDSNDAVYKNLKVWNDFNGDGKSQDDEIRSIEEAGVESIDLGYTKVHEENAGNIITERSFFRRFDGAMRQIADAQFRYLQNNIMNS